MRDKNTDISISRFTKQIVCSSQLRRLLTLNILCYAAAKTGTIPHIEIRFSHRSV